MAGINNAVPTRPKRGRHDVMSGYQVASGPLGSESHDAGHQYAGGLGFLVSACRPPFLRAIFIVS